MWRSEKPTVRGTRYLPIESGRAGAAVRDGLAPAGRSSSAEMGVGRAAFNGRISA